MSSFSPPQHTPKTLPFPYTSSRKAISADREGVPAMGIRKTWWHRKAWGIWMSMCWWLDGREGVQGPLGSLDGSWWVSVTLTDTGCLGKAGRSGRMRLTLVQTYLVSGKVGICRWRTRSCFLSDHRSRGSKPDPPWEVEGSGHGGWQTGQVPLTSPALLWPSSPSHAWIQTVITSSWSLLPHCFPTSELPRAHLHGDASQEPSTERRANFLPKWEHECNARLRMRTCRILVVKGVGEARNINRMEQRRLRKWPEEWKKNPRKAGTQWRRDGECCWVWRGPSHGDPLQYSCLENPMDGEAW